MDWRECMECKFAWELYLECVVSGVRGVAHVVSGVRGVGHVQRAAGEARWAGHVQRAVWVVASKWRHRDRVVVHTLTHCVPMPISSTSVGATPAQDGAAEDTDDVVALSVDEDAENCLQLQR